MYPRRTRPAIALLLAAPIAVAFAQSRISAQEQFGQVSLVIGRGDVRPSGALAWDEISIGRITAGGDRIRTEAESSVELLLAGGGRFVVGENSSAVLGQAAPAAAGGKVELARLLVGAVFCDIEPRGEITVATPTAVCAVRGTGFALDAQVTGRTLCLVSDGVVAFASRSGGEVELRAGQASLVEPGRPPSPPRPMTPAEKQMLADISGREVPAEPAPAPEQPAPEAVPAEPAPAPEQPAPEAVPPAPPAPPAPKMVPEERPAEVVPEKEARAPRPKARPGRGMGVEMGAVDIEGKTYKQISLRPEIPIGKIGIGLDLPIYLDENGSIRKEDWDEPGDYLDKIYYIRYGEKGDAFHLRAGALDRVTLGYGLIMDSYSNTVQYPDVRKSGVEFGIGGGRFGIEGMVANLREMTKPGLVGGRGYVRPIGALEIGATMVVDGDQYGGLLDTDGDGYPDVVDDFPRHGNVWSDTDGDGIPDQYDYLDADGDQEADSTYWFISQDGETVHGPDRNITLDPEPFNLDRVDDSRKRVSEFGFDVGYPIINGQRLRLDVYTEYAKIDGYGSGMVLPGARLRAGPLGARLEFRQTTREFQTGYFSRTYDLERAVFKSDYDPPVITKARTLELITQDMRGIFAAAELNLLNVIVGGIGYEQLSGDNMKDRNLTATLSLDTDLIPKVSQAEAYYINRHIPEGESLLRLRTERTVIGFVIAYAIGDNADLMVSYRETYRDRNGDGSIDRKTETIKTSNLGTRIRF